MHFRHITWTRASHVLFLLLLWRSGTQAGTEFRECMPTVISGGPCIADRSLRASAEPWPRGRGPGPGQEGKAGLKPDGETEAGRPGFSPDVDRSVSSH